VNSFGMDWTLIEMVPFVAAIFLYTFFFRTSPIMRSASMSATMGHPSAAPSLSG
jgi:hypothetical protein